MITARVTYIRRRTIIQRPSIRIALEDVIDTGSLHITADTLFDSLRTQNNGNIMIFMNLLGISSRICPLPVQTPVARLSQCIVGRSLFVRHILTFGHLQTPHTIQASAKLRTKLQTFDPRIGKLGKNRSLSMKHACPIILIHSYLMHGGNITARIRCHGSRIITSYIIYRYPRIHGISLSERVRISLTTRLSSRFHSGKVRILAHREILIRIIGRIRT